MIKVMAIFGTRPEAIKMAPVLSELTRRPDSFRAVVVVTAQHREMLDQVLGLFSIVPDYDLNVMSYDQSLTAISSKALVELEPVLKKEAPDVVLVQGDTTTTFFGALAAFYQCIPVGHVEAGLRTRNKFHPYPEEINRHLTSVVADLHFAPTTTARDNLLAEGVDPASIYVTGNTVIDALLSIRNRDYTFVGKLADIDFESRKTILVTAHRRESFGEPLREICLLLKKLVNRNQDVQVIYPVHMNPHVRDTVVPLLGNVERIHLVEPLEYELFVHLMDKACIILTDSGGIQEEAPSLGKPVLVLREVTERPEAVEAGTARVVGTNPERIMSETELLLRDRIEYKKMVRPTNPYGDGRAAKRIVDVILARMCAYVQQCG